MEYRDRRMRVSAVAAVTALLLISTEVAAQSSNPRPGSVAIVVHDLTDLPILGAEVTLMGADGSLTKVTTDERGEARFERVLAGLYTVRVASVGFDSLDIEGLSIRAGERASRRVTLQIARVAEQVGVVPQAEDLQLTDALIRQLTPDQLAALPEDPEELAQVLALLAGADADIRVDGFRSGQLPLGTQIQDIRIHYDVGAASSGGGPRVEIRTIPGGNRWRNNAGLSVRDESLAARNSFSRQRPSGQTRQYSWGLNGPLARNQTGLSVNIDGSQSMDNQTIRAAALGGIYSGLIEQPSTGIGIRTRLDHQITPAHSIRIDVQHHVNEAQNQGIGEFDLPERAFTSRDENGEFQFAHHATLRRGYVNDLRLGLAWDSSEITPLSNAIAIQVLDAFTSGGAQQQGGRRSKTIQFDDELEFVVRQRHNLTAGVSLDGSRFGGNEYNNASGTFTFASLAALEAGRPATFSQRLGDPSFHYSLYRFAWHFQDDYRVHRNLIINLGVRHDFQTHLSDWVNFSPRLGISWTASSKTRTTLRASAGMAHSPMDARIYEQLLLVDGDTQRDVVISDPGYPDPFSAGLLEATAPASVIRARNDLVMPSSRRYSVGIDQPFGKFARYRGTFVRHRGHNLFRSRNANAPVDGVRPDPSVFNIIALETTARSLNTSLQNEVTIQYPPKRFSANVSYVLARAMNDADGAFSLPPNSFDIGSEWGPNRGDVRHSVILGLNSDLAAGFRVAGTFRAQSSAPYTITLGTDPNGDGVHNERPAGVTRNSERGAPTKNLDLTLTWRVGVGQGGADEGAGGRRNAAARESDRRVELFARGTNVLNFVNPQNFSGVLTSPFFGLPTSAGNARRVVVGTRVWF
jgi:carboxypeptidase family protein